jgi:hypothetical protein
LDTTVSAHLKALGRLAHHRYSRRWRLSSHASSWGHSMGRSFSRIQAMLLAKRRMILPSRISPDLRNQTNTKYAAA